MVPSLTNLNDSNNNLPYQLDLRIFIFIMPSLLAPVILFAVSSRLDAIDAFSSSLSRKHLRHHQQQQWFHHSRNVALHEALSGGADQVATTSTKVPPDVTVRSQTDIPSVPPDWELDVYYAEQIIQELGTVGELVETYHSGLIFRVVPKNKHVVVQQQVKDIPAEFTIQWYAFDFPFGAFLPTIQDDNNKKLVWANDAWVHYTPAVDPDRWTKGEQLVGRISGHVFNKFVPWTIEFCKQNPGYQAFDVWDRSLLNAGQTRRWTNGNTCSAFTEAALRQLATIGGNFRRSNSLIRRSYVPLISKRKPKPVNMKNKAEADDVQEFYQKMRQVIISDGVSTSEFIRFIADKLDCFYVYESHRDTYWRIELSQPYIALAHLYQPMSLPWQIINHEEGGFEAEFRAETTEENQVESFAAELASAFEGGVNLLRRRLPPVIKRRLGPKLIPITALVCLFPVTFIALVDQVPNLQHVNGDFVSGLFVGLAAGLLGSRILAD